MDLSGKIVFKVRLDKEIKKLVIHNDDINYNELLLMMQRIFSDKIKPLDEISIKYTDEENDLITLSNDSDVLLALQNSKILKLTIFLNDKEDDAEELKPADIVKELQNIRLSIDNFLVKFDTLLKTDKYKPKVEELSRTLADATGGKLPPHTNGNNINTNLNVHKEFDPLNKKSESNDAIKPPTGSQKRESRAHTPDSVGSLEFSPNPKKYDQFNNSQQQQPQHHFSNLNLNSLNGNNATLVDNNIKAVSTASIQNGVHDSNNSSQFFNQQQQQHHHLQHQQQVQAQQQVQQFQSYNSQPQQQQQQQVPPTSTMQIPPQMHHSQQPPQQQAPPQPVPSQAQQFYPGGPGQPLKSNQGMPPSFVGNAQNPAQISAPLDPMAQQQMYQQQQQPPQNWHLQQQQQPQQQPPQPPSNVGFMPQQPGVNNPYAKPPNANALLHRPSSTTIYQQGYK